MRKDQCVQIKSLAFYIFNFMKLRGEPANILDCIPQGNPEYDYHDILREANERVRNSISRAEEIGAWSYGEIEDIDKIDISREDYEVVVRQIYPPKSVKWYAVEWQGCPPQEKLSVFEACFEKYVKEIAASDETRESVNSIMGRLNALLVEHNTNRVNGLVVGRVQSGKTQNFTGLVLKAIAEQWNMIIVLTSDNTALASQTRDRLRDAFSRSGLGARHNRELNFLRNLQMPQEITVENEFVYWGVAMKETHSLQRVINCLNEAKEKENCLEQIKLLIIDDEADNATPNSVVGSDRFSEDEVDDILNSLRDEAQDDIANWLASLLDFDIPEEQEEQTEEQQEFLSRLSTCTARNLATFLEEYRTYLNLSYENDEGQNINVYEKIMAFYQSVRGRHLNSRTLFIKLLKSIFDIAKTKSTINHKICQIIDLDVNGLYSYPFKNCAYIGYTATPYACVFNERPDQTPIYPGFIYSLGKGRGYFGLDEIFGLNVEDVNPHMPIIYPISKNEETTILAPLKKDDMELSVGSNLITTYKDKNIKNEWVSLKKMITWGFCAAAARRSARKQKLSTDPSDKLDHRWTSVLVNIAPRQAIHSNVKKIIVNYLRDQLADPEMFRRDCLSTWDELTSNDKQTNRPFLTEKVFKELFPSYGDFAVYPERNRIEEELRWFIEGCKFETVVNDADNNGFIGINDVDSKVHVIEINSTPEGKNNQCDYVQAREYSANANRHRIGDEVTRLQEDHLWIISGGNTISRGLTLPGLVSSYFDRIKKNVAVDTMTQMGRWFGYRQGYELLPRLAMTGATISEIKKVAVIEHKMHEEIEEKFDQNVSPSDPTGYLTVYTCGRKLSGRQKALRTLTDSFATFATTSQFYLRDADVEEIYAQTNTFLGDTLKGFECVRDPNDYQYAHYALWDDIPATKIGEFLGKIKQHYPTKSKLKLESLQVESQRAENCHLNWSVVVGEPSDVRNHRVFKLGGRDYKSGNPEAKIQNDVASYSNTRLHLPYYAMIPKAKLREIDLRLLRKHSTRILGEIRSQLSSDVDAVLRAGATLDERFENTLAYYEHNTEELPNSLHSLLNYAGEGYRNRSASDYIKEAHDEECYKKPILQIYLITPPEKQINSNLPIVSVAVFWPDHDPDGFVASTLGLPEDFLRSRISITPDRFYRTVGNILQQENFPIKTQKLRSIVCNQLGCDEAFFAQRIRDRERMAQYNYEVFPGREAYCPCGWAQNDDHQACLDNEFAKAAYAVLLESGNELTTLQLMQKTVALNPKFDGFYNLQQAGANNDKVRFNSFFQKLINDENLPVKSPSLRPRTYVFDNGSDY